MSMGSKRAVVATVAPRKLDESAGYENLAERMKERLIGQDEAVDKIVPFIEMYEAGFCQKGRPVANLLCLGTTGVGKTVSAEILSECLHGDRKKLLRIDCGEYQKDHETARLVGAPSGYLGHRETPAVLNSKRIRDLTSDFSDISVIVFDEIEKASPSLNNLLLGVLDKGVLMLGDTSVTNFENSIIFMTSNLGAKALKDELDPGFGYAHFAEGMTTSAGRISSIGTKSAKGHFSPEFRNRLDEVITYNQLTKEHLRKIVELELNHICDHLDGVLQHDAFGITIPEPVLDWLIDRGFSKEYGARNLKRLLRKEITLPLARLYNGCMIGAGSTAVFAVVDDLLEITVE